MGTTLKIRKEDLATIQFPKHDVIDESASRDQRRKQLIYALFLGNKEKQKVTFLLEDKNGDTYELKAIIWGLGADHVSIKYGYTIPVGAIKSIGL